MTVLFITTHLSLCKVYLLSLPTFKVDFLALRFTFLKQSAFQENVFIIINSIKIINSLNLNYAVDISLYIN